MSKRKNIKKYLSPKITGFSGVSLSESFLSQMMQEDVFVDISDKVRPYTRSIILHVSQHGKVIGSIHMTRRP